MIITSMNYYPLFRAWSWNNGMSFYILLITITIIIITIIIIIIITIIIIIIIITIIIISIIAIIIIITDCSMWCVHAVVILAWTPSWYWPRGHVIEWGLEGNNCIGMDTLWVEMNEVNVDTDCRGTNFCKHATYDQI